MNKTVTIAPVRKSVRVKASQAHAFEVFTAGLDRWWPRRGTIGTSPMKTATIEPRLGGRWYETGEDGSEATVGKILLWDPRTASSSAGTSTTPGSPTRLSARRSRCVSRSKDLTRHWSTLN